MEIDTSLDSARGLDWLVKARNESQSLMLRLLQQWDNLGGEQRRAALGAAFSLWRAVFLLVKKEQQDDAIDKLDSAAKRFLEQIIRTNAIGFNDDLKLRAWSSTYYVDNARYRIIELTGDPFDPFAGSPISTVREAWNEAFERLDAFVSGSTDPDTRPEV